MIEDVLLTVPETQVNVSESRYKSGSRLASRIGAAHAAVYAAFLCLSFDVPLWWAGRGGRKARGCSYPYANLVRSASRLASGSGYIPV